MRGGGGTCRELRVETGAAERGATACGCTMPNDRCIGAAMCGTTVAADMCMRGMDCG
jgi:hypothetical protein